MDNNRLDISFMELTELPESPLWANVTHLYCQNNTLSRLPPLPMCKHLECHDNLLEHIPLAPRCETIICSRNRIAYMPVLRVAYVTSNRIPYIEESPYRMPTYMLKTIKASSGHWYEEAEEAANMIRLLSRAIDILQIMRLTILLRRRKMNIAVRHKKELCEEIRYLPGVGIMYFVSEESWKGKIVTQ